MAVWRTCSYWVALVWLKYVKAQPNWLESSNFMWREVIYQLTYEGQQLIKMIVENLARRADQCLVQAAGKSFPCLPKSLHQIVQLKSSILVRYFSFSNVIKLHTKFFIVQVRYFHVIIPCIYSWWTMLIWYQVSLGILMQFKSCLDPVLLISACCESTIQIFLIQKNK